MGRKSQAKTSETFSGLTYKTAANRLREYADRSMSDSDLCQFATYLSFWLKDPERSEAKNVSLEELFDTLEEAVFYLQGFRDSTDTTKRIRLASSHARMFLSSPADWTPETAILNLVTISMIIGEDFHSFVVREYRKDPRRLNRRPLL